MIFLYIIAAIVFILVIIVLFDIAFGSEIKVDNTKKRVLTATVVIMDCYHNDTGCEVLSVDTNTTDLGNVSEPARGTNL